MDRLAQCCAAKQQRSTLVESGTEDSGAQGTYGSAESTFGGTELETSPVDRVLQKLTTMHEGLAEAETSCVTVEDIPRLFAERAAFTSQLLEVIGTMAQQIKELQDGGDTQATSLVRSAKKLKVERSPFEQVLSLAKSHSSRRINRHTLGIVTQAQTSHGFIGEYGIPHT